MSESTTRRKFLEKTVAATAAISILPRLASSEESLEEARAVPQASPRAPLAESEPIRMAVIGTGGMGTAHCEAFLKLAGGAGANVRIEALSDVCQPRLLAAKKKVDAGQGGDVATYGDYRQLLARKDLHGVLIASPEHWHGRMAEEAIKAGKDVYLEKPMTLNLKDALRLQQIVHANPQVVFCVGTQYVMTPSYQAAQTLIADGAIGKPVWSQTSYCRNSKEGEWTYYEIDPEWKPGVNLDWKMWCGPLGQARWSPEIYARWRRYRKYSTGIIGDLLVHQMTPLIRAMNLGWPVRVVATGGHYIDKKMENHDQVNLTVEFENEHTMVVAGSTCNELGLERLIRGHKGNLYVGGRNLVLRPERIYADEVEEREIPGPVSNVNNVGNVTNVSNAGKASTDGSDRTELSDHDNLRLHWLACIRTREKPLSDIDLGTKVMVIVDLATRSIWEGAAFEYDPRRKKVKKV